MFDRAAAAARQGLRLRHPDLVFVEQPPEQVFKRQRCARQFIVRHRLGQQADMLPIRMILPHMQPLATDLALGKMLERSEEHTSELQSLMRISYTVFCFKKKKKKQKTDDYYHTTLKSNTHQQKYINT